MSLRLASEFIIWDIAFRTLKSTSSAIIDMSSHLLSLDSPGVKQLDSELQRLDLATRVKTLSRMVDEISPTRDSVRIAVEGVKEILERINSELSAIDLAKKQHGEKLFATWRQLDYSEQLQRLVVYNEILTKRLALLRQLSELTFNRDGAERDDNQCQS
jgi:hypothetical protein